MLVCTGKDLVKLSADHVGDRPLWAVGIEIEFLSGRQSLESRLQPLCPLQHGRPRLCQSIFQKRGRGCPTFSAAIIALGGRLPVGYPESP